MELQAVSNALIESQEGFSVEQMGDCLAITNEVGIVSHLAVVGSQITVETLLFPAEQVKDVNELNSHILATHKLVPLTAVSTTEVEGNLYYSAFGALSSESKVESVVIEVVTLFSNTVELLDAYSDFLK
ncbi:Cytoplasmic protein [Vibrio crassostreae]|nr:Cytoplasmic protein [Vibrio chagasii]CAK2845600.1 Cytoplasmic protein [Vibrio crassostreae]